MSKFTVKVWEDGCGAFIFKGIEASSKNEACQEGIEVYKIFAEDLEIKTLNATATLER
jgi:hypothetical protein